mmetsp:Transcript_39400/g.103975  ORF Transcript_39400/g.103975 Transcript_39400/m.103975 type:complete len:87 (+) Transcript_39400:348-608(+)
MVQTQDRSLARMPRGEASMIAGTLQETAALRTRKGEERAGREHCDASLELCLTPPMLDISPRPLSLNSKKTANEGAKFNIFDGSTW